jgi:hypothetical protein
MKSHRQSELRPRALGQVGGNTLLTRVASTNRREELAEDHAEAGDVATFGVHMLIRFGPPGE